MTSPAIPWSVLRSILKRTTPYALSAIAAELRGLGYEATVPDDAPPGEGSPFAPLHADQPIAPDFDEVDRALERAAKSDADEVLAPRRRPSPIPDTDPAPPPDAGRAPEPSWETVTRGAYRTQRELREHALEHAFGPPTREPTR